MNHALLKREDGTLRVIDRRTGATFWTGTDQTEAYRKMLEVNARPAAVWQEQYDHNPMVNFAGAGPEATTCQGCKYLICWAAGRTFYKCRKRAELLDGTTKGKGTDHRPTYHACAHHEAGPQTTLDIRYHEKR